MDAAALARIAEEQRRLNAEAIRKLASEIPECNRKPPTCSTNGENKEGPIYPPDNRATVQPPYSLWREPSILKAFRADVRKMGVVGEETVAATVYLLVTSRLLDKPVSAAIKGLSSSGKSFTLEQTLKFFPPESVVIMTAMSERALVYNKDDYKHRTLVLYEATALREGAEDNQTAYFVRTLLSEGHLKYPVTVRDKESGGFKTITVVKEGPTNMIVTTTKARVHAENETRLLSLNTNDTPKQTKAILYALADESIKGISDERLQAWHQLQAWLQTAEHRVTIPFAKELADFIPPVAVRLRRDFGNILNLIKSHAILHQASRPRDNDGRIIAKYADYEEVHDLVAHTVAEAVGQTVSDITRETVKTVNKLATDDGVTGTEIAKHLKLDKTTVSRRLSVAASGGYIRNMEERRGKPGRWVMGDPLPAAVALLPSVAELENLICNPQSPTIAGLEGDGCSVACTSEGIKREAPSETLI